jgi:hypothetical protein
VDAMVDAGVEGVVVTFRGVDEMRSFAGAYR